MARRTDPPFRADHVGLLRPAALLSAATHGANAAQVGLDMPATTVLIFGNPAVGTHPMLASPDLALDLPSRVLIRENAAGTVEVLFTDPVALSARYGLDEEQVAGLTGLVGLVESALGVE